MKKILWTLAALPFASGCASEHMGDDSDGSGRSMALELEQVDDEIQRHHQVVMNAWDATEVTAETAEHDSHMQAMLDDMGDSVSHRMRCEHGAENQMHSTMETMRRELAEHMSELQGDPSLGALQAACTAYVTDMHALLDDMHHVIGTMSCMH